MLNTHRIEFAEGFCVWTYAGPGRRARGFWHPDLTMTTPMWAYALRSPCGTFWETSRARGGYNSQGEAIAAAKASLSRRKPQKEIAS